MNEHAMGILAAFFVNWIGWIIGAFGVAGLIALWIFAPAAMSLVAKVVVTIVTELLETRLGCALIAAVIVGIGVSYMRGSLDDAKFAERTARFEAAQKQRDASIAVQTRALVLQEAADLKASAQSTDADVKDFKDAAPLSPPPTVPPVPGADPMLVGHDACQLRRIAGLPPCRPPGHRRMPNARKRAAAAEHQARQQIQAIGSGSAWPAQ